MLRSLKSLEHYDVGATDGDIGRVVNFLMDDARWTVRYLVVDTGGFWGGRQVLITPISFLGVDFPASRFRLSLTRAKVEGSPDVDLARPVSRQHERDYYAYYGYPRYWGLGGLWGAGALPEGMRAGTPEPVSEERPPNMQADAHLRSAKEITGYAIEAKDGSVGHVTDFVVDDETWEVRYLVLGTSVWWPGKRVLVAPEWATRISWTDKTVYVAMTREAVRNSPPWIGTYPVERDYQDELSRHYGGIPGWKGRDRGFAPKHDARSPRT
jgi:hypothetical protein